MASKTWNIGVVGYGFSAKIFHIPFVQEVPELKLYAVVQRTPKPDDDAEKDHPGIKSYRTTEEMVKDAGVEVVIITTAPDSHFELAKLALESGKHGMWYMRCVGDEADANWIVLLCSCVRETIYSYFQGSGGAECYCEAAGQVARCVPEYVLNPTLQDIF